MSTSNRYVEAVATYGIDHLVTVEVHSEGRTRWRHAIPTAEIDAILAEMDLAAAAALTDSDKRLAAPMTYVIGAISRWPETTERDDRDLAKVLLWMACTKPYSEKPKRVRRQVKAGRGGIIWTFTPTADGGLDFEWGYATLRSDPLKRLTS